MKGNICPQCGNPVMPYSRFMREAEPYKVSSCGSCGVKLKRSPKVYLYLLIMVLILIATSTPLFLGMMETRMSIAVMWTIAIVWIIAWGILINYLSWRNIGWVAVEQESKQV